MEAAIEGKRVMKGKLYADILGKWIRFSVSPVHMAHECIVSCVDISAEEARRRRLHRANTTNETVIRVIRRLVSEPCFSQAMQGVLSDLSEAIHPDRLYVLETDRKTISNTYEWCAPGVKSEIGSLQNLSYDEYMLSWEKCLETDTSVVIPDIEELRKQGYVDGYNILKRQNIRNLMSTPLYYQGKLIGFLVADNYEENEMMNTRYLLETVGAFMAMYVVNRRLLEQLEFASGNDSLTGVKNRNAMDIYFYEHADEPNQGILFMDVNNLKYINDVKGHAAGDKMLQELASFLCRHFPKEQIYHSGGDEFMVIIPHTDRNEVKHKMEELRRAMKSEPFSFSIGHAVSDGRGLRFAAAQADRRMYQDKREYYRHHKQYRQERGQDVFRPMNE